MPKEWSQKEVDTAQLMGHILHAANPSRSVEEWTQHTLETGDDAKAFFGSNGIGYEEYLSFVSRNDRDKVTKQLKEKARKRALGMRA